MSALLEVDGLVSGYGSGTVLHGVNLSVGEAEVLAVVGRNGAGKTTMMETIMGMVPARFGAVRLAGVGLTRAGTTAVARAGVGYVPQGRRVFPPLTVDEHLRIAARPGRWSPAAVYERFPRLAERRGHGGGQLSGGEQQMLAVGRALCGNPRLLLLDEPSDGLAPVMVRAVMELLAELRSEGMSVLLVEQHVSAALTVADRAAVLDRGKIVFEAPAPGLDKAVLERLLVPGGDPQEPGGEAAGSPQAPSTLR